MSFPRLAFPLLLLAIIAVAHGSACTVDPEIETVAAVGEDCSETQYLESLELLHWANQRRPYEKDEYGFLADGIKRCITQAEFGAITELYESIPKQVWEDLKIDRLCETSAQAGILRLVEPVAAALDTLGERWDCDWFHASVAARAAICEELGLNEASCEIKSGTVALFGFNPSAGLKLTMRFAGGANVRLWRDAGRYAAAFVRRNWFKIARKVVPAVKEPLSAGYRHLQSRFPFGDQDLSLILADFDASGADLSEGAAEVLFLGPDNESLYQVFPVSDLLLDSLLDSSDYYQIRIDRVVELEAH